MKGWLDKYGKEINANEGRSSAPDNWVGEGYSNVGRNYSPAWGGQFQLGGNVYPVNYVPQAQDGISFLPQQDPEMMYTDRFNTQLNKDEQNLFAEWAAKESERQGRDIMMDKGAYDVQGFWKSGDYKKMDQDNHGTDTWKKPNHPTFSNQSKYHGVDGFYGGNWNPNGGYQPSKQTADMYGPGYYNRMFAEEPGRPEHLDASRFTSGVNKPSPLYFAMGGSLPGSVGFTYARTQGIPSNGPYAKKTKASAQDGIITQDNNQTAEDERKKMMEFYKNRPSNLSGERAAENISRAKFEEGDPEALKKADYLAYSYQQGRKAPGVVYNPDLAAYEESGGNINESLQHELSHVGFYNIPNLEKLKIHPVSPKEFSRRWSFKNEGDKVVPISKGDAMYYTRPNEIYARRKGTSDFFGLDMTKPVSDDDFNRMIKLRQTLDPSVTEEQYQELIKKDPKLGEEVERLKATPGGNNILNFLNAMPDDVKKYRNIFNEVTAIPGEQAPIAQNGMTYYQHGLDWKPKSISKNGSDIPKNQNAQYTLPRFDMPRAASESTSLGTKIDEAALRQASIDAQRKKQGQIRKAEPDRSMVDKAMAIVTNPMTALKYKIKGQDIPENFERGEKNPLDYAVDIVNPATYVNAAGRTVHNITSPKEMLYRTLNSIEGDDDMLDVAGDALLTAGIPGLTKSTLGTLDKQFSKVGRNLERIRIEGEAKGLTPHEIAKQQMQEVGITSNQRTAYRPILSNLAEKYITPYGYEGMEGQNKLQQTINNIRKGGLKNRKINLNKDIAGPFDRTEIRPERSDAWRLYLGKPQEHNTFRIAETSPVNHPSYSPEQLINKDIYSINSEYAKLGIKPNTAFPELISPSRIEDNMDLLRNKISIDKGNEIMGGYNKRLNQYGLEYNDIWDLQPHIVPRNYLPNTLKNTLGESSLFIKTLPNGVQIPRSFKIDASKVLGKPFMSHEVLPYTSSNLTNEMNDVIDYQIQKLRESPYDMTPKIQKMEVYKEELKKYPKQKKGGVIKDDRGQWAHPGEITEIGSNQITMQGVDYPVLGISDKGDTQMMFPGEEYKFKGKKVTEFPMKKNGGWLEKYK